MRDTQRERERQKHRQREKQAPCREPDVGLDPGTPGSRTEPKADAQPLSHPGAPKPVTLDDTVSLPGPSSSHVLCPPTPRSQCFQLPSSLVSRQGPLVPYRLSSLAQHPPSEPPGTPPEVPAAAEGHTLDRPGSPQSPGKSSRVSRSGLPHA